MPDACWILVKHSLGRKGASRTGGMLQVSEDVHSFIPYLFMG